MNQFDGYAAWQDSKSREYDSAYAKPIEEKLMALQEALAELSESIAQINKQLANLDAS